ncbi:DMT family transporter [Piscinibacter terrae]|uniref:DMT family transporter n=1 Tax=Piscinibacter terrae TaxID=2496871 RepID=A0A3N7JT59_9BURK|nr:DMT family transporter [Albitalea terrae]RQP22165.1 DMT family transporter [Albitalea terrae]
MQSSPHASHHAPWLSYLSLASAMALVGTYVGFSKLLVVVFPVFLLAWLRFGIAAVAMLSWVKRSAAESPMSPHDRWLLFLESFLGNFLFSICMLFGVAMTSALAAGVIMAAIPGVVALLSTIFLKERISTRVALGIACAVGGIALVSLVKHEGAAGGSLVGNLLLVGAVFCEASYVVIGKRLTGNLSAKRISALVNLWGLALVTPFGLWQALHFDFSTVHASSWVLLLFYSLAASMFTVWLWMTGLRHVPASSAGVFTVMLPVSAATVGVLLLGEQFSAVQAAAYGLALAGVVLATWPGRGNGSAAV